jgi:hypothetical protein
VHFIQKDRASHWERVLHGSWRQELWSVDSEYKSRVIEPRNHYYCRRLSLFIQWERPWTRDKRVRTPQPGSESGANVQEVIRERVRAQCLWRQQAADGQGGIQMNRAFLALRGNRGGSDTKEEQAESTGRTAQAKRTGRAVSSRSAVIVPETGEPRPKEP